METKASRIERVTYLIVPASNGEVSFEYPAQGTNNYQGVADAILKRGLQLPTGNQTASLLHESYCGNDEFKNSPEAQFIRKDVMKNRWLWVFNRNLWTARDAKNAGVYVQFDSQGKGNSEILKQSDLEDALSGGTTEMGVRFSKDRKTAFASYNTVTLETQKKEDLAKNGFLIASYDIDGAEKLSKVAKAFTFKPYVWGITNDTGKPVQVLSALVRFWIEGDRLLVVGNCDGDYTNGFGFGIRAPSEASK